LNRRKQFRAVATRFDKLAVRYQATVCVADIFIWLRARPDRPRGNPGNTPSGPEGRIAGPRPRGPAAPGSGLDPWLRCGSIGYFVYKVSTGLDEGGVVMSEHPQRDPGG
jgi:hypothetical protein